MYSESIEKLRSVIVAMQTTSERREQLEKRMRSQLEKELKQLRGERQEGRGGEEEDGEGVEGWRQRVVEQEGKIAALEADVAKVGGCESALWGLCYSLSPKLCQLIRQVETPSHHFCAVMIDCHNCYCLLLPTYYHSAAAAAGNSGRFVGFISTVSHEFLIAAGDWIFSAPAVSHTLSQPFLVN